MAHVAHLASLRRCGLTCAHVAIFPGVQQLQKREGVAVCPLRALLGSEPDPRPGAWAAPILAPAAGWGTGGGGQPKGHSVLAATERPSSAQLPALAARLSVTFKTSLFRLPSGPGLGSRAWFREATPTPVSLRPRSLPAPSSCSPRVLAPAQGMHLLRVPHVAVPTFCLRRAALWPSSRCLGLSFEVHGLPWR